MLIPPWRYYNVMEDSGTVTTPAYRWAVDAQLGGDRRGERNGSMATLRIAPNIEIPLSEVDFSFVRSSGPGGQNVNKLNTKAVMRWNVVASSGLPEGVRARFIERYRRRITTGGDIVLSSQRYRHQQRNIDDCLQRLRSMIAAIAVPPKPRRPTRRSRASVERRLRKKSQHSEKKHRRGTPRLDD